MTLFSPLYAAIVLGAACGHIHGSPTTFCQTLTNSFSRLAAVVKSEVVDTAVDDFVVVDLRVCDEICIPAERTRSKVGVSANLRRASEAGLDKRGIAVRTCPAMMSTLLGVSCPCCSMSSEDGKFPLRWEHRPFANL